MTNNHVSKEWEEEFRKEYMDYMQDGTLYLSVRNFIRKHIKPKPSWGEVMFKIMDKYIEIHGVGIPPKAKIKLKKDVSIEDILNHFKQYFTERE